MKLIITFVLAVAIVLFIVTQLIIPLVSDKWDFLWLFKSKPKEGTDLGFTDLNKLKKETTVAVKQVEKVKEKVNSADNQLKEIKSQIQKQ